MARNILRRVSLVPTSDLVLGLCTAGFLVWVLLWQYGQFVAGVFGYHDLTIISDFFSNAWLHARPFWVTNAQQTHLKTHFTPSLLLLAPAFVLFESQFALIAIVATTVCLGMFIALREQLASLDRLAVPRLWSVVLVASCFVAFAANRYTLRVLSSAHFEPVFILTAFLLLRAVSKGAGYRWLLPLLFLALGVRQDAGFFLFFLLLACLVAPRAWGEFSRVRLLVAAAICIAYVGFASKVIMPWFGNDGGTRFWQEWGDTWPQVFLAWLRSPARVMEAIDRSEFVAFNAEFSFVPALNPLAWAATQAPSILFYTANAPDKQHLFFYNAAFLLPGVMLCFAFAQLHVATFVMRVTAGHTRTQHAVMALIAALFAYVAVAASLSAPRNEHDTLEVGPLERRDPFAKTPLRELTECPNVRSVAADFHGIVYAPLWLDKYLQENAAKADLVVVARNLDRREPLFIEPKRLVDDLTRDGKYVLAGSGDDHEFYLSAQLDCASAVRR